MLINLGYRRYIISQLKVSSCTLSGFLETFDTGGEILLNKEGGSILYRSMLLNPQPSHTVLAETAKVAKAIFPKGNLCITMAGHLGSFMSDQDFSRLFSNQNLEYHRCD